MKWINVLLLLFISLSMAAQKEWCIEFVGDRQYKDSWPTHIHNGYLYAVQHKGKHTPYIIRFNMHSWEKKKHKPHFESLQTFKHPQLNYLRGSYWLMEVLEDIPEFAVVQLQSKDFLPQVATLKRQPLSGVGSDVRHLQTRFTVSENEQWISVVRMATRENTFTCYAALFDSNWILISEDEVERPRNHQAIAVPNIALSNFGDVAVQFNTLEMEYAHEVGKAVPRVGPLIVFSQDKKAKIIDFDEFKEDISDYRFLFTNDGYLHAGGLLCEGERKNVTGQFYLQFNLKKRKVVVDEKDIFTQFFVKAKSIEYQKKVESDKARSFKYLDGLELRDFAVVDSLYYIITEPVWQRRHFTHYFDIFISKYSMDGRQLQFVTIPKHQMQEKNKINPGFQSFMHNGQWYMLYEDVEINTTRTENLRRYDDDKVSVLSLTSVDEKGNIHKQTLPNHKHGIDFTANYFRQGDYFVFPRNTYKKWHSLALLMYN